MTARLVLIGIVTALSIGMLTGCEFWDVNRPAGPTPNVNTALLPAEIRLHPFTQMRKFSDAGGISEIEARVEAIDHFGETTKAFGTFRFEAFAYRPHEADPRGGRLATWAIDLSDVEVNLQHRDKLFRTYKFRLHWSKPIAVGEKFVLRVTFSPSSGSRLFDQATFVAGE